jgi:hypothetical protein
MSIKYFMEAINYRITEGSDYLWSCFGGNAYCIDSWNGSHDADGYSASCIFDRETQEVYQLEVWDYGLHGEPRQYRWINPDYIDDVKAEYSEKGIDFKESIDGKKFIDLELQEDILNKMEAIVNGESYDTRIQIPLELPDSDVYELMKLAHEKDITFNQLVEEALEKFIDEFEKDPESTIQRAKDYLNG